MADASNEVRDRNFEGAAAAAAAAAALTAAPTAVRSLLPSAASSAFQSSSRVCDSGDAVVRDGQGRSFSVPARMGLSSSVDLPGMSFEDSSAAPTSLLSNSMENSGVTSVGCSSLGVTSNGDLASIPGLALDGMERSLNESAVEGGAFAYESMDALSPDPPQHDYQEALGSYQFEPATGASDDSISPAPVQGSCAVNSAFFEASGSVELEARSSPIDGMQSASAAFTKVMSVLDRDRSRHSPLQRPRDFVTSPRSNLFEKRVLSRKRPVAVEKEEEPPRIPSLEELQAKLEAQRKDYDGQVEQLQRLLTVQYSLTGANPLSTELGSSVLGSRAVKKPEDTLAPDASSLLRGVYALKDTVTKREARDLSMVTGATRSQVKDFFVGQQSRVKRLLQLTAEGGVKVDVSDIAEYSHSQFFPTNTSPITTLSSIEAFEKLLDHMRVEKSFTGQSNLVQLVLEADYVPGLRFFLENGGLRVFAKWLSQAASEEQTSLLKLILKALFHLPMIHANPAHVSPLVQIMTKLRVYFSTDVAGRARTLLTKWSKLFARNGGKSAGQVAEPGAHGLNSSSGPAPGPEKKKLKTEVSPVTDVPKPQQIKPMPAQPNLKGLDMSERPSTSSNLRRSSQDDPAQASKKRLAEHGKEKRSVVLVEELTATRRIRDANAKRPPPDKGSRPLSVDDIKKAKMRARLLQGSTPNASRSSQSMQEPSPTAVQESMPSAVPAHESTPPTVTQDLAQPSQTYTQQFFKPVQDLAPATTPPMTPVPEFFKPAMSSALEAQPKVPVAGVFKPVRELTPPIPLDAPPKVLIAEFMKRTVPWCIPPVVAVDPQWSVAGGEESKEKEVQSMRVKREAEEFYSDPDSVPKNPRDPWDVEPDYDDSLTLHVPLEDGEEKQDTTTQSQEPPAPTPASGAPTHDPELLALLLRNPALVSELTSQGLQGLKAENTLKPAQTTQFQHQPVQSGLYSIQPQQQQVMPLKFQRDNTFQPQRALAIDNPPPFGGEPYREAPGREQQPFYHVMGQHHAANAGDGGRGPWSALDMFQGQAKQQQQHGGGGAFGGGYVAAANGVGAGNPPQVWNRVSNNNLSFHQHHHHQQHQHHHQHLEMGLRTLASNLDGSSRFARPPPQPPQAQQQQSSWYNAPRPGW